MSLETFEGFAVPISLRAAATADSSAIANASVEAKHRI
jgi:hypothetical protein